MTTDRLIDRIALFLNDQKTEKAIVQDLSAAVFTSPDTLWVASDEMNAIERLKKIDEKTFGEHETFYLSKLLNDFDDANKEVDIEGMDYDGKYIWLIGSHSTKRKKAKVENVSELKSIKRDKNRYLLARIPVIEDRLEKTSDRLHSAYLKRNKSTNQLIDILKYDPYLGDILAINLPGKDNGFDIEGLLVHEDRIFIGLRGPVLRGIAIVLEIVLQEKEPGILSLKAFDGDKQYYKKHFLDLDGLGIRDLCIDGEDILVLAGPTMVLDGSLRVFRWQKAFNLADNSFSTQKDNRLEFLFEIPFSKKSDRAEGLTLLPQRDSSKAILVVYDSPAPNRVIETAGVYADVFQL